MQENFILNERSVSQNPAIEVLKKMGYTYLSREECAALRDNPFGVLLKPILKIQLEKLNSFKSVLFRMPTFCVPWMSWTNLSQTG